MSLYDPDHYKTGGIETWDYIAAQQLDYYCGCAVKYISRAGKKPYNDEIDDLLKAKAYIEKKIALVSGARNK